MHPTNITAPRARKEARNSQPHSPEAKPETGSLTPRKRSQKQPASLPGSEARRRALDDHLRVRDRVAFAL